MYSRQSGATDGGGGRRGQTLHDYVAGITVFVIAVALVLGLLPSVVAPFQAGEDVSAAQAARIADRIVENNTVASAPNTLATTDLGGLVGATGDGLRDRFALPDYVFVNVSLTRLNDSTVLTDPGGVAQTAGESAAGERIAAAARVVRLDTAGYGCEPACRVLVRVW